MAQTGRTGFAEIDHEDFLIIHSQFYVSHDVSVTLKRYVLNQKLIHRTRFEPETFHSGSVSRFTHKFERVPLRIFFTIILHRYIHYINIYIDTYILFYVSHDASDRQEWQIPANQIKHNTALDSNPKPFTQTNSREKRTYIIGHGVFLIIH